MLQESFKDKVLLHKGWYKMFLHLLLCQMWRNPFAWHVYLNDLYSRPCGLVMRVSEGMAIFNWALFMLCWNPLSSRRVMGFFSTWRPACVFRCHCLSDITVLNMNFNPVSVIKTHTAPGHLGSQYTPQVIQNTHARMQARIHTHCSHWQNSLRAENNAKWKEINI